MRFGKYRLLEQIGEGGMATVSRAVVEGPKGFELEVVIKRIRGDFSDMSSKSLQMLLTEARVSAKLRHPSIVQVYELGDVDGEYYLAMEMIDGWNLRTVLDACMRRGRPMPPEVACFIVGQVASALAYAHTLTEVDGRPLGILHRDVSPSNVMVTPAGSVKLLDFGIARVADHLRDDQPETAEHTVKGKLLYMSPEQIRAQSMDGRSDQFALGIIFYELLTKQRPFNGKTTMEMMFSICDGILPPPSSIMPRLSKEVDAVVLKMLARDRRDRYPDCNEAFAAITSLTRRLAGDAAALQTELADLRLGANNLFNELVSRTDQATMPDGMVSDTGSMEPRSSEDLAAVPTDLGTVIFRDNPPQLKQRGNLQTPLTGSIGERTGAQGAHMTTDNVRVSPRRRAARRWAKRVGVAAAIVAIQLTLFVAMRTIQAGDVPGLGAPKPVAASALVAPLVPVAPVEVVDEAASPPPTRTRAAKPAVPKAEDEEQPEVAAAARPEVPTPRARHASHARASSTP